MAASRHTGMSRVRVERICIGSSRSSVFEQAFVLALTPETTGPNKRDRGHTRGPRQLTPPGPRVSQGHRVSDRSPNLYR